MMARLKPLIDEGVIRLGFTPDTTAPKYDPLPEGQYPFVIVQPKDGQWMVETPEWKLEYALAQWNERENAKPNGKPLASTDDLPFYKKMQVVIPMVVREGEYKGRHLPSLFVGSRFNTDAKYLDKSNWYKLLKVVVPDMKARAEIGNLPDFDTEVVGYGATAVVEINDRGRNKVTSYIKDSSFGKKMDDTDLAALLLGATVDNGVAKEGDPEIPFHHLPAERMHVEYGHTHHRTWMANLD